MAKITVTAANVLLNAGERTDDANANAAIGIGNSLYKDASGKWGLASNDVAALNAGSGGVAISLSQTQADGQPISVARSGTKVVFGSGVLVAGEIYVIGSDDGAIEPIGDLISTEWVTILGYAEDTSILVVSPIITGLQKT